VVVVRFDEVEEVVDAQDVEVIRERRPNDACRPGLASVALDSVPFFFLERAAELHRCLLAVHSREHRAQVSDYSVAIDALNAFVADREVAKRHVELLSLVSILDHDHAARCRSVAGLGVRPSAFHEAGVRDGRVGSACPPQSFDKFSPRPKNRRKSQHCAAPASQTRPIFETSRPSHPGPTAPFIRNL